MVRTIRCGGFGLIEVVVAMTLLSVGMLGLAATALMAGRLLRAGETLEQGGVEVLQVIDSLVLLPRPTDGERRTDRLHLVWRVSGDSQLVRIDVDLTHADGRQSDTIRFHLYQRVAP